MSNDSLTSDQGFGCHCDLDPDMKPDGCVLDDGNTSDCVHAMRLEREGKGKWHCVEWRRIEKQPAVGKDDSHRG